MVSEMKVKLTNREELLFLVVLALPKASNNGLAWTTCSSKAPLTLAPPSAGASSSWIIETKKHVSISNPGINRDFLMKIQ